MKNENKIPKRTVNGILLLDKPLNLSSNTALQIVKRLFNAKKAGHTGSLDPLATGLLPICFGEATKFSQYLLDADKTYLVKAQLGIRTKTGDAEGEIISTRGVSDFNIDAIKHALNLFLGASEQVPPMYSALKFQGQPLYKLARQNIEVERAKRKIFISRIELIDYKNNIIEFSVDCSKGTYIRTLVDDLGEQLACGAHVIYLRRTAVGRFDSSKMSTPEEIKNLAEINLDELDKLLLPIEEAIAHMPISIVNAEQVYALRCGQAIFLDILASGLVNLQTQNGEFIGVGETVESGKIIPRRLVSYN